MFSTGTEGRGDAASSRAHAEIKPSPACLVVYALGTVRARGRELEGDVNVGIGERWRTNQVEVAGNAATLQGCPNAHFFFAARVPERRGDEGGGGGCSYIYVSPRAGAIGGNRSSGWARAPQYRRAGRAGAGGKRRVGIIIIGLNI